MFLPRQQAGQGNKKQRHKVLHEIFRQVNANTRGRAAVRSLRARHGRAACSARARSERMCPLGTLLRFFENFCRLRLFFTTVLFARILQ